MLNIFEQPWLLIIISVVFFIAQRIFRAINIEKCPNKYLLVPFAVLALAFFADYMVKTDAEKINKIIKDVKKSIISENAQLVSDLMSDDYYDDYHRGKERAITHLKSLYLMAPVQTALIVEKEININDNLADVKIKAGLMFEPQAPISSVSVTFSIDLAKSPDRKWLISSSQIRELNKQPVNWGDLP